MPDSAPVQGTLMQGKRGLIMGVTNDRSLGWGIAQPVPRRGRSSPSPTRLRPLGAGCAHSLPRLARRIACSCATWATRPASTRHSRRCANSGRAGLPGPRDRVRGQDLSAGPLPRHTTGRLPAGAGYLLLLVRRRRATGGADDATRRQPADTELCRRGTLDATLQRDGRGEGGAGSVGALPGCRPGRRGHQGERDQRGADTDVGLGGDWGLPLHPALEPVEFAHAAERHDWRCGGRGRVFAVGPVGRASPARCIMSIAATISWG